MNFNKYDDRREMGYYTTTPPVPTIYLGNDVQPLPFCDAPHLLIAGATGSGKSNYLHALILKLICDNQPETVQLLFIDLKRIELSRYQAIPHTIHYCNEYDDAIHWLSVACSVMDGRYRSMERAGEYICTVPHIIIIIDELADLMLVSRKKVEPLLVRLAQLGRAANIHLVLATQRPTVDVVTGLIKANVPTRVCFQTASTIDSRIVIDTPTAYTLTHKGDCLIKLPTCIEPLFSHVPLIKPEVVLELLEPFKSRCRRSKRRLYRHP